MKKIFYLVAASLMMTSCLKDGAIEAYNEEFASVFGDIDPLHTWKMVENQSVEVNLDKPSRVKIYVKAGNSYRLAGDYENVSGKQTLSYDAPMGCEDIHVTVNGVPYQGVNSRAGVVGILSESDVITMGKDTVFTYGEISTFHKDVNTLPETVDNREKVKMGCQMISNGKPYEFYPIYWAGVFKHKYGLYYYYKDKNNQDQIATVPIINEYHKNAELGLIQRISNNETGWTVVTDDYAYDYFFTQQGKTPQAGVTKPVFSDETEVLKSKCFTINLPEGTKFGFYVDVTHEEDGDEGFYYSDPELNTAKYVYSTFAYLHTDEVNNISYITVEDYTDNDYNDFIFMLKGEHTHVVEEPVKYIYAVEDLGGTNDFDFNDIVFSVSHVAGKENATVQPLAAGGIYEAKIYFNDTYCGEIHSMFGDKEHKVMINTKAGTTKSTMLKADPFLVNVGTDWSNTATSYSKSGNGFKVKIIIPDKPDKEIVVKECNPGGKDSAPQMLVLSENWLWPTERTRISDAYTEFDEWCANYTTGTWAGYYDDNNSWFSKHTNGLVVNWK